VERIVDREEFHIRPKWPVAEEYEIDGSRTVVVKKTGDYAVTTPLEDPDLFLSFARLGARGRPSDESILRWVSEHGLLTLEDEGKHSVSYPWEQLKQAPISLDDFVAEVLRARSALNLYTTLNERSVKDLKQMIHSISEDYRQMKPLSEMDEYFYEKWRGIPDEPSWTDGTLQFMAIIKLEVFVMSRLANVRPAFWSEILPETPPNAYKPVPSWHCPDLLSALYQQLFLWMTSSLPMRRCANPACGTPFPVTRKDKRVCSPTCRSNLRHYPHLQQRRIGELDTSHDTNLDGT
jgi:hypothetical protein